jgi:hypothetical protein
MCKEAVISIGKWLSKFLICFIISSSHVFAQLQTGAIEGTIRDNDQRPISGATVKITSPSLIGNTTIAYADEDGHYRFPLLSSGVYEVLAELDEFETKLQKDVRVFTGKTLRVDFQLELTKSDESIEVIEEPPLIDTSTTAVSFTIAPETIQNLPKLQRIQNAMAMTPGVGDDLVAYGSDGEKENSYLLDGVNIADPRGGRLTSIYNYNWIQEVQVAGIGAPAEYGGFTGVVGNFITRSGSNNFHGLFETFFQNENLVSSNLPDPAPEPPFKNYDVNGQVGGPIIHDKLWFFSGIQYDNNEEHPFGFDGVITEKGPRLITKVDYKLNSNNSLQGLYHWSNISGSNVGGGAFALPEATFETKTEQSTWNAQWTSLLGTDTNVEARFSGYYDNFTTPEDRPDLAGHQELTTSQNSVNAPLRTNNHRSRHQVNTVLSHYANDFIKGNHEFRFGVEVERSHAVNEERYNGGGFFYIDYRGMPYTRYYLSGFMAEGFSDRTSAFGQDDWNLTDKVNISVGFRWDHNRGTTDRGVVYSNDPIAPRIGAVWTLDSDAQTAIKVHFGDYYQALLDRNFFFIDNQVIVIAADLFNNGEWKRIFELHNTFDEETSKFKQPFVRQFSIGIDKVLPYQIPIGAHYIYRKFANIVEDVGVGNFVPVPFMNPLTGESIDVYSLMGDLTLVYKNVPELYRRYDGIELFASKQLSHRLSISGSFVYSKLRGNYPGTIRTTRGCNGCPTPTVFLNDPNSLINYPGRLIDDPTFSWKLVGNYSLPLGFNTGWFFRHTTGDTWAATSRVGPIVNQPNVTIFVEPAGSRRFPSQNLLDLRLEKQIPFYKGQLRFTMDMFNVFNSAYAIQVESDVKAVNFAEPVRFTEPRQMRLGIRYTF